MARFMAAGCSFNTGAISKSLVPPLVTRTEKYGQMGSINTETFWPEFISFVLVIEFSAPSLKFYSTCSAHTGRCRTLAVMWPR